MNKIIILFFFIFSSMTFAGSDGTIHFKNNKVRWIAPLFFFSKTKAFEAPSIYSKANCVEVYKSKKNIKVGLICDIPDKNVLAELGIFPTTEMIAVEFQTSDAKSSAYTLATPISSYPMDAWQISGAEGYYSTDADCDIKNGPIYRPTATCLSAFLLFPEGGLLYVDITLRDNVKRKDILSKKDALKILSGFVVD